MEINVSFSGYGLLTLFWLRLYTFDEIGKSISLKSEHRSPEQYNREKDFEKLPNFSCKCGVMRLSLGQHVYFHCPGVITNKVDDHDSFPSPAS